MSSRNLDKEHFDKSYKLSSSTCEGRAGNNNKHIESLLLTFNRLPCPQLPTVHCSSLQTGGDAGTFQETFLCKQQGPGPLHPACPL